MTTDNDRLPITDDTDTGLDDDAGDVTGDEQDEDDVAVLKREIAELRNQNNLLDRGLKADIGRLHSLIARAESGRGSTEAQQRQIAAQVEAVKGTLAAVLDDDTISPEIRARARAAAEKAEADAKLAGMQAQLEARRSAPPDSGNQGSASEFEEELVNLVESHGLNPDDAALFDWQQATQILNAQGKGATRAYFRQRITEAKATQQAATRRQTRKEAGKGSPPPDGANTRNLDPSLPLEDRLKKLIADGVISA